MTHASDCSVPDNDAGNVDLSLRPHGLLLNDSEVTSPDDSDMIHVVFRQAKFLSNTRHCATYAGAPATHCCACHSDVTTKKMTPFPVPLDFSNWSSLCPI